ncbi:hypothetical protein EVAR_59177_1 [Eumeta japonica]|uniref:Uncharacterized protein n=1 Tax=Eumeta variegata TaxID=151549 RepID=A0A4C1ZHF1_EUMVA|nr:hypothetical protein EVAR_59177_1 [Eumeta japonica]
MPRLGATPAVTVQGRPASPPPAAAAGPELKRPHRCGRRTTYRLPYHLPYVIPLAILHYGARYTYTWIALEAAPIYRPTASQPIILYSILGTAKSFHDGRRLRRAKVVPRNFNLSDGEIVPYLIFMTFGAGAPAPHIKV